MNRAEEKAEEYCKSTLVGSSFVKKMAYLEGYRQATKDICQWLEGNLYDELAEDLKKYLSSQP